MRCLPLAPVLVAITAQAETPDETGAKESRPNLLLSRTDDQGYGDLGATGNPEVFTPHIDRFAPGAVQVDRFFVSPVCAPTRARLPTGRLPLLEDRTARWPERVRFS